MVRTRLLLVGAAVLAGCGGDDGDRPGADGGDRDSDGGAADGGCSPPCARAAFNFTRPGGTGSDVFLVDLSGSEPAVPVRLTPESVSSSLPTGPQLKWAPSSLAIAWDADGSIYHLDLSRPAPGLPSRIVPDGVSAGWEFRWSADSRWIAFEGDDAGARHVWVVDVSSGSPDEAIDLGAATLVRSASGVGWHPTVSGLPLRGDERMSWVDLTDRTPTVTPLDLPEEISEMRWSPLGNRLAVLYNQDGSRLGVMDFDGAALGPLRLLAGTPPKDTFRWSPDGNQIAYSTGGAPRVATLSEEPPDTFPVAATTLIEWLGDGRLAVEGDGQEIFIAEVGPSSVEEMTSATMGMDASVRSLSPDRGALVFVTMTDDGLVPYVVELDGTGEPRQIGESDQIGFDGIGFTPSSMNVVYGVYSEHVMDVDWMLTDRDGEGELVPIGILHAYQNGRLYWSPSDDRVLWSRETQTSADELYFTDLGGGEPGPAIRVLPNGVAGWRVGQVAWAP